MYLPTYKIKEERQREAHVGTFLFFFFFFLAQLSGVGTHRTIHCVLTLRQFHFENGQLMVNATPFEVKFDPKPSYHEAVVLNSLDYASRPHR